MAKTSYGEILCVERNQWLRHTELVQTFHHYFQNFIFIKFIFIENGRKLLGRLGL